MTIPIRNLYYIFCYAWARFPQGEQTDVGEDDCPDLPNLFAKLLIDGMHRLIRRGLDRGYVEVVEDTRSPRGRLLLDAMVKEQTLLRGMAVCRFDELQYDVLHNQILKATARLLSTTDNLLPAYRHELALLVRRFEAVADIRLTANVFGRVQLSRNNRQYAMLMQLCEFVFHSTLPDQQGSGARFADILEDEVRMSAVFEDFLRNFYGHEQQVFRVGRETMAWDAEALSSGALAYMPFMETDITMRSKDRTVVVDAKYYKETLVRFRGSEKLRSSHLYQLFTYLRHTKATDNGGRVDGALIYPAVGYSLSLDYRLPEHHVRVVAVDLNRPWPEIHQELLAVLFTPFAQKSANLGPSLGSLPLDGHSVAPVVTD